MNYAKLITGPLAECLDELSNLSTAELRSNKANRIINDALEVIEEDLTNSEMGNKDQIERLEDAMFIILQTLQTL